MKRDEYLQKITNKISKFETFECRAIFNNFSARTNDVYKGVIVKDLPLDALRLLNIELDNSIRLFLR